MKRPAMLHLRAVDAEDLSVIAACLQDALVPLSEMAFLPDEMRFVAVFDRFMWESCTDPDQRGDPLCQVQCALRVEHVAAAKVTGIDQADRARVLELLTLVGEPGSLTLVFSGDGAVRLTGEGLVCYMEDLATPRRSRLRPSHDVAEDTETAGGTADEQA